MVESRFLNVACGDAILIRFKGDSGNYVNILIDGGYVKTYQSVLKPQLKEIHEREEKIDLLIITHYDSDHIGGILSFIRDQDFDHGTFVDRWWTNVDVPLGTPTGDISIPQLLMLKGFLLNMGKAPKAPLTSKCAPFHLDGAKLTILSPNPESYLLAVDRIEEAQKTISGISDSGIPIKELLLDVQQEAQQDSSIPNGSSLAILLQVGKAAFLLLADAHHTVVSATLQELGYKKDNRLKVNWLKVAHHGSRTNTSNAILDCLDCKNFVLSVNGNNRSGLPHKQTLVRILKNGYREKGNPFNFYFTHNDSALKEIFHFDPPELVDALNFNTIFPEQHTVLTLQTQPK